MKKKVFLGLIILVLILSACGLAPTKKVWIDWSSQKLTFPSGDVRVFPESGKFFQAEGLKISWDEVDKTLCVDLPHGDTPMEGNLLVNDEHAPQGICATEKFNPLPEDWQKQKPNK